MSDVHLDLSAHYGSHAVRRGLAKPLGPCVHPVIRKGGLAAQRGGVHGPRYMRVWVLRLVRRHWCARCGVWLTYGGLAAAPGPVGPGSAPPPRRLLPTLATCRVRRRRLPLVRASRRRSVKRARCVVCCTRCLGRARAEAKRAVRAATPPLDAGAVPHCGGATSAAGAVKASVGANTETRLAQRRLRQAKAVEAAQAMFAQARVPRRNRRCRRRSQRRRRLAAAGAAAGPGASIKTLKAGKTGKGVVPLSAQVTQRIAASLMLKPAPVSEAGAGAAKSPKAPATVAPTAARLVQKGLQGLVPTGPLKKPALRQPASAPGRDAVAGAKVPDGKRESSSGSAAAPGGVAHSSVPPRASTVAATPAPAPPTSPSAAAREKAHAAVGRCAGAETTAHTPLTVATAAMPPPPAEPPAASTPLTRKDGPAPPVRGIGTAKTALRPPAKAVAATAAKKPATSKKQLMDAMSKLGF